MANKIQIRRDTTTNWTAVNPILSEGELGLDTTLDKIKIGNGTSTWSALSFYTGTPSSLVNGLHTISLNSSGVVTFPEVNDTQLTIEGSELFGLASVVAISSNDAVVINTYNPALHAWEFSNNGTLTVPTNSSITPYSGNITITTGGNITILHNLYLEREQEYLDMVSLDIARPWTGLPSYLAYPLLMAYTTPNGVLPLSSNLAPVVTTAKNAYTEWQAEIAAEKVIISTGEVSWDFSASGGITFPTLSVDIHNGGIQSAQVLQFNDATKQVIITGPTPANDAAAQRIIIQGQRGTGTGEGGDVYIWGGDSAANGGDIKIYAGDGEASPSNGGYVNIAGGNGYAYGGDVTLTAGHASQFGGNVVISAGNAGGLDGVAGHVTINASNHSWTFGNNGILTVPGNIATDGNHLTGWSGNLDLNINGSIKLSADANCALTLQANSHQWAFGTNGNLTLPKGGSVSETSNTIAFAPPTAAAGQSLVIRPTAGQFTISTDHLSGFVPGESITITVSTQFGSDSGELYYTITGATTEQLGRATTGTLTFSSESTKAVTWTIPVQSSMTTFTFDLTGGTGFPGPGGIYVDQLPEITVTLNGSASSENNHVHLVAGNPTTVDMYLGDDDQYVKIEKNAGNVVVGTNLNAHQWTFGTNSNLTLPNASTISPVSQVGYSYGPYTVDIYDNHHGGALSGGTQTVITIGNTVHNNLFDPPVPNATTTTGTIALNGDFDPGTSTGTFDLTTNIIVSGQSLGDLRYRDDDNHGAGFTLASPSSAYTGPVVTAGTLISGYSGWITRTPKTTTYIRWADGSRSQVTGSSVNLYPNSPNSGLITTDNVSGKLFPATLYTANYIPSGTAIGVNSNDWKFRTDGKLTLPGTAYNNTSPNYIHANQGIGLHPSHNTGGTGPELYIYYNDGIVVQPFTNDYFQSGTAAAPLFIRGSDLPSGSASTGKTAGDVYIIGGSNYEDETYGKVIVNSGITSQWQFNSSGQLTFPDTTIQHTAYREPDVTNQFYVDPFAANTYTPTGSILKPFRTIAAAQAEIEARITANTLVPGELNPIFIVLTGSITENVTLTRGHVFLTTLNGSIHTPIYLTGQITINGDNSSTGAIDANHFAITGLTIVGPNQGACIYFTGTNAQRLQVQDIWLTARGSQTGTTPFVNAGGYGIFSDNSGVRASDNKRSPIHGSDVKISHTGSGDVYCFRFSNGSTGEFDNVETSGATQVGAAGSGSLLAFTNSTLDANGEVILEAYSTGSISVNNCLLSNSNTGVSYGIWLHDLGGNAIIINTVISVASSNAASRMIKGNATDPTGVFYNNIMVGKSTTYPYPDLNKKVDNTVVLTALTGAAGLTAVNP
jgi:hypothetical protein